MIKLPNSCYCSNLTVFPSNWEKPGASIEMDWRIQYYFHDPAFKDDKKFKYGKLCVVKGMNKFKTLGERREAVKQLMAYELSILKEEAYNPITKTRIAPLQSAQEINEQTGLIKALEYALANMKVEKHTREDACSVLRYVTKAAIQLQLNDMPVSEVKRKNIRQIMDQCATIKEKWSANTFNYYRAYLSLLFKDLVELEAIEHNPVKDIAKQKTVKKMRQVLRPIDRVLIRIHLTRKAPEFYRFIEIFFHGGGRIGEMLRLRGSDVNLKTQKYRCLIKKGKNFREVERTIKNAAMPYWKEALKDCGKDQVIFSVGLHPGETVIRSEQITRRWKLHVKKDLKVLADFYALKHLNTDETAALLSINDAAAHNSHMNTAITLKHYAVGEKERQHERLKKLENKFA